MKMDSLTAEIISLVKTYCKPAVVSALVKELKNADAFERKLTKAVGRSGEKKFSLAESDTLDHLLTLCHTELSEENNISVTLGIGDIFKNRGELARAEELYSLALAGAEQAGDEGLVAEAYLRRGDVFSRQGKWEVCENDLDQSRKIYRKLNELVAVGKVDNITGTNCAIQGRLKQAQAYYRRALSSFERFEDARMTGTVLMNLGIVYNILGQYEQALSQYQRALSFFEKVGDRQRLGELHHNMGMSYLCKGEYKQALSEFNRVGNLVSASSSINLCGLASLGKANACFHLKDLRMALSFVHHALTCFTASSDRLSIADSYKVKGMIHREMKKYSFASSYFQTSLRLNMELKSQLNTGETYYEIGVLEVMKKQPAEAKKAFEHAVECFKAVGARKDVERTERMLQSLKAAKKSMFPTKSSKGVRYK